MTVKLCIILHRLHALDIIINFSGVSSFSLLLVPCLSLVFETRVFGSAFSIFFLYLSSIYNVNIALGTIFNMFDKYTKLNVMSNGHVPIPQTRTKRGYVTFSSRMSFDHRHWNSILPKNTVPSPVFPPLLWVGKKNVKKKKLFLFRLIFREGKKRRTQIFIICIQPNVHIHWRQATNRHRNI